MITHPHPLVNTHCYHPATAVPMMGNMGIDERGRRFGQRVRHFRQNRGLSMRELAERVAVTYGYVRAIETGHKRVPPIEVVERIARALDVSMTDLIEPTLGPVPETRVFTAMIDSVEGSELPEHVKRIIRQAVEYAESVYEAEQRHMSSQ